MGLGFRVYGFRVSPVLLGFGDGSYVSAPVSLAVDGVLAAKVAPFMRRRTTQTYSFLGLEPKLFVLRHNAQCPKRGAQLWVSVSAVTSTTGMGSQTKHSLMGGGRGGVIWS